MHSGIDGGGPSGAGVLQIDCETTKDGVRPFVLWTSFPQSSKSVSLMAENRLEIAGLKLGEVKSLDYGKWCAEVIEINP